MKPALTAEEWAADSIQRDTPNGDVLVIVRDKNPSTQEAGGHHHALAALGLYGKPFGFDTEDVQALLALEHESRDDLTVSPEAIQRIRLKIEALLPAPAQ